ncbi:MoxR family ATPase [Peterkaempfera bronchialis]|uniref:MoxR family ATPase n=2 Tax=Peterkaempfera bronchialis TaxID=2126346 RepID=A0A345T349_9ACTN|nr:MoxR family ATPase [Peterkaempfera bronchialis]
MDRRGAGGSMDYAKQFDPEGVSEDAPGGSGGSSDERVYVFDDHTVLAVNVALATGRPLLVSGPPGSGKSTLAPNVARVMGYRYYCEVVTARTEDQDLLWREEMFRQLSDAREGRFGGPTAQEYHRPGALWMALDPSRDPELRPEQRERPAVVLIDEIDKADPDFPNALLVPLGELRFPGPGGTVVTADPEARPPLVVVTTNEERSLSGPFLRRCIALRLEPPGRDHLLRVAELHLGDGYDRALAEQLADHLLGSFSQHRSGVASTAEYLDTLRACRRLGVGADSPLWRSVADLAMVKSGFDAEEHP